jgi:hypothetical protein
MKFALIFALMLLSYFGYSQEWALVGGTNNFKVYLAKKYVGKKEGIITVWEKYVFNQPILRDDGKYESYRTYLQTFDCENGSSGLRQIIIYDKNNNIIYREIINHEIDYIINPPGSIGEIVLQKVCSTFNKKK